jgi:hypothetical protein
MASKAEIVAAFREQVRWCDRLGSPFTARLMARAAEALEGGGKLAELIGDWPGNPNADGLPLRVAAAFHALALSGEDAALSAVYPPHAAEIDAIWRAAEAALAARPEHFRTYLASAPQTNEVGRSALLLPGFLEIARVTGLPLRLLEIGASAGLNSMWDRYRYDYSGRRWGDPASPIALNCEWRGPPAAFDTPVAVTSRAACDRAPIDLDDPAQRAQLRAYIWADQTDRLERLDAAIALTRASGVRVERADAGGWLEQRMREPAPDCTTVMVHSVVWQYLPAATRQHISAQLEAVGARATARNPLAWLSIEIPNAQSPYQLRLKLWLGGGTKTKRELAHTHPHGAWIEWLEGS